MCHCQTEDVHATMLLLNTDVSVIGCTADSGHRSGFHTGFWLRGKLV